MGEQGPKKKKGHGSQSSGERDRFSNRQPRAAIGDPRFARLHTDPRFQRLPKNETKVSIDSRFAGMFTDKAFGGPTDGNKRGIKAKNRNSADPLRRYYKLDEDDAEREILEVAAEKDLGGMENRSSKKNHATEANLEIGSEFASESKKLAVSTQFEASVRKKQIAKKREARKLAEETALEVVEDEDAQVLISKARHLRSVRNGEEGSDDEDEDDDLISEPEGFREEGASSSSSSSSSSSDSEGESDDELSEEEEEKVPTTNDETRRLAMMNMDWEHIRSVHLLVLLRSFAPKGGSVHSVSIYPSEFGIEQMKEENLHGPKSIFKNDDVAEEDEEGADPEKLREYEKAKLRYYYAVVECDSTATAAHLYRNCDGLEFERTSNTLDFRYIPDELEFKRAPRDAATEVPADYKPVEFETRALQHSNVKLTWDDDEPVRVKALRRNFNRDELNELDFRAYVGSSSDSEFDGGVDGDTPVVDEDGELNLEEGKDRVRSKYLSLLSGVDESGEVLGRKIEKGNIEIKFHTGLDELSEKLLSKVKKDKTDETVWEAYQRRKREKKKGRKQRKESDASSEDDQGYSDEGDPHIKGDPFFSHGKVDPFDDPFFNQEDKDEIDTKSKRGHDKDSKERKAGVKTVPSREEKKEKAALERKEAAKNQAELELLLLDDHMVQNGEEVPKTPALDDSQKRNTKKKKGAKVKREELGKKLVSSVNYDDPRFSSLFTSHHFALDPTDPHFKQAGSHIAELQSKRIQSFNRNKDKATEDADRNNQRNGVEGNNPKRKAELNSLVRSLKTKFRKN